MTGCSPTDFTLPPLLAKYVSAQELTDLIARAKAEDLGPIGRDITTLCLVPSHLQATARLVSRQQGRLAGLAIIPMIVRAYDPHVLWTPSAEDGQPVAPSQCVGQLTGPLASILAIERIALNFTTHLSGIASLTDRFVQAIAGTGATIVDTRKTLPGLRALQKYAVVCGGGKSHRLGLYDALLVKDNHIAHIPAGELAYRLGSAIETARRASPPAAFVQIEVDTLDQLQIVLHCDVDMILLDNMPPAALAQAVTLAKTIKPKVILEASGGVNLQTVRAIAESGVDRISIGALTHSAPSLDMGLDIHPCPQATP